MGFSGVEVGSVLALYQYGNIKPRQFMIGPGVALNRLGFNTPKGGLAEVARNLEKYQGSKIPIGISIGKNREVSIQNAPLAHAIVASRLYEDAAYFVIDVSSPSTPGLRQLQDKAPLTDIVQAVNGAMDIMGKRKPLFVKIAPDLENSAVDDVIEVVRDNRLTGIIATNTTINSDIKAQYGENWRDEMGGLSGDNEDYRKMATEKVRHIYSQTNGAIEIIGVGGVKDWVTALEKIKAGAKVVQVVTAIRGEGLAVASKINKGLVSYLEREGMANISDLVGVDNANLTA
jgi:dihydroorotate dehydrogenase